MHSSVLIPFDVPTLTEAAALPFDCRTMYTKVHSNSAELDFRHALCVELPDASPGLASQLRSC